VHGINHAVLLVSAIKDYKIWGGTYESKLYKNVPEHSRRLADYYAGAAGIF
jgi:hypothetical protein